MKKIMIFAAFAAALSLASCQKDGLNEAVKDNPSAASESPVFTGTINAGTKTTVDAASGKVSWETTDEITVTDKDQKTAVYSIESIDGTTGRATFVYKSGDTLGEGPYTATYGNAPKWEQTYTETPGQLYMTAQSETTSLTFSVQCGLMELNLTKDGELVNCIAVSGTTYGEVQYSVTYTLHCDSESIEEGKSFYIALPAGRYHEIVITDSDNKVCTLESEGGVEVAANHIKPVTLPAAKLNFKAPSEPFARMDPDKKPRLGKDCVTNIVIETNVDELPTDEEEDYALKMNEEGTIWQVLDGETLYIKTSATEGITLPQDASKLFQDYFNVTEITGLDCLSTNEVEDMSDMFSRCSNLQEFNLSSFNTEHVMNMERMFSDCAALPSLDLSGFNTENVTNMSYMFNWCESMGSLTLPPDFNTENVTNMSYMFSGCSNLQELNLSSFNTEHVMNMASMFFRCSSLSSLDLANFNTDNVMEMSTMFGECGNIEALDLSSFNTEQVTDMSGMFIGCSKLAMLTLNYSFVIPDFHDDIFQGTGVNQEMTDDDHCHVYGDITDETKTIIEGYENMTIG